MAVGNRNKHCFGCVANADVRYVSCSDYNTGNCPCTNCIVKVTCVPGGTCLRYNSWQTTWMFVDPYPPGELKIE